MVCELTQKHCKPCEGGVDPLTLDAARDLMRQLHQDWQLDDDGKRIEREFSFKNYYETMAFVNAAAWVAHREDHHPDLEVGYNRCRVAYHTHAIGGLSENDFICAAKTDALLQ
jgi:4a-hydroxytetrahydrobiopterin dehydratase